MLVFVDESGNTGMKLDRPGTSPFFVVTAVVFEDRDEAALCDQAITRLRESLGWHTSTEFHFNKMSRDLRLRFLAHVVLSQVPWNLIVIDFGGIFHPPTRPIRRGEGGRGVENAEWM